jgi:hypothetical protein
MAMKGAGGIVLHQRDKQGRKNSQRHADIGNQAEKGGKRSHQQGVLKMDDGEDRE